MRFDAGPDLSQLDRLLGDVLFEEQIARTGRAAVFRVRTGAAGGRSLALKVALAPSDAEDLARFRHEVRLLSEAHHPNVVQVLDFGVLPGGFPFLTMELMAPERPGERLAGRGWETFFEAAIQAAAGLAHIHRQGVVHMDIKPGNLGLAPGEQLALKILDFGLAQAVRGPLDRRIRGTLAYTAPEVLLQDSYDQRADLYSLGMTLFELATGLLPSAGDDLAAIRFHLEGTMPDPRAVRPDMPPALARIVTRLLQRNPCDRFASAGKLLVALGEAAGRPIDEALAAGAGAVLASRLIGRGEVLERLRGALALAAEGRGGAVLLEGPEGSGKSRLLREFRLLAAVEGACVARGRGVAERPQPLGPFLEALGGLGIDLAAGPAAEGADPRERYRLYQAVAARLAGRAQPGSPVVLLLDDLHLAGPESAELLAYLAEELRGSRVLLVAAATPAAPAGPAPSGAPEEEPLARLRLAPLDRGETSSLIDACLGTSGLPPSFYSWLYQHTEGSPAAIQRLLRHLVAAEALQFRDGDWKPSLAALARWDERTGVETLDRQRIAALPAAERQVLAAAALLGEPFRLETLAALLEADAQPVYERLSGLVRQGHLERLEEAGATRYAFTQLRFRQTVYQGLEPDERVRLHRRAAELLSAGAEGSVDTAGEAAAIAEHFWRGGEKAQSLPYLLHAAEAALALHGHAQAAALYGRAVEAAVEAGDPGAETVTLLAQAEALAGAGSYPRALKAYSDLLGRPLQRRAADRVLSARVHLKKGRLHARLGEHEEALAGYEEGLSLLAGLEETELEIDLLHSKAQALRDLGDVDAAFAAARSALARAGEAGLERQRASLLNTLGTIYSLRGDWRRAGRLIRRGLWVAERAGDERLCLTLRNNLGNVFWKTGDYEQALDHYSRNLAQCERTHDLWGQVFALNNLGILECSRGHWQAAREPLLKSLDLKRRLGAREGEALARLNLGEVEEVLGNWPRAQRHYERALKLLEEVPEDAERFAALAQIASLERKRGRMAEAERRAREALAGAERIGDSDLLAHCHLQLGLIDKDRGQLEAAQEQLARALALLEAAGTRQALARLDVSLADLALRRGELPAAARHAAEARRRVEEMGDRFALGKLLSIEARVALARDEVELAERLFAEGVRLLEELAAPYEHARSLHEWGLASANPDVALDRLRRALALFERLGAEGEAQRSREAIASIREHQRFREAGGRGTDAVLSEVGKVINSSLDLQEVLDRTMDLVIERLGAERGMIVLADPLTRELAVAVARNLNGAGGDEARRLPESVVRRVLEAREPVLAADALSDGRFAGASSIVARHILSILCVPLTIRNRPAGAIYVDHSRSSHLFGQRDLDFLVAFADQAAIAIDNARLYGELDAARHLLKEENESLRREILSSHHLGSLIGKSRAIAELKLTLERVAQSPSTVLIRGESGTGKGLVARILHSVSPRRQGPFIHFNCAALPETLVESELFGHEKGAFTGAAGQKPGRFELADRGTMFLDEIGKISRAVQSKLLRVVEDKEFERVGGTRTLRSDVRIIAATNLDLERAILANEFREDLYYRLNIIPIVLPPLRDRLEDIPYLVQHFLGKISRDLGLPARQLDPAVLDLFYAHTWPGNVRELESAIHRALVLATGDVLTVADFGWIALLLKADPEAPRRDPIAASSIHLTDGGYEEALARFDRQLLAAALAQSGGKIRETARLLGIARNTLKAKMKRYGLEGKQE